MFRGLFCIGIGLFCYSILSNTIEYGSNKTMSTLIGGIFIIGGIISIFSSLNNNDNKNNSSNNNESVGENNEMQKILTCKKLFDDGIITKEEFEKMKKQILN